MLKYYTRKSIEVMMYINVFVFMYFNFLGNIIDKDSEFNLLYFTFIDRFYHVLILLLLIYSYRKLVPYKEVDPMRKTEITILVFSIIILFVFILISSTEDGQLKDVLLRSKLIYTLFCFISSNILYFGIKHAGANTV